MGGGEGADRFGAPRAAEIRRLKALHRRVHLMEANVPDKEVRARSRSGRSARTHFWDLIPDAIDARYWRRARDRQDAAEAGKEPT